MTASNLSGAHSRITNLSDHILGGRSPGPGRE